MRRRPAVTGRDPFGPSAHRKPNPKPPRARAGGAGIFAAAALLGLGAGCTAPVGGANDGTGGGATAGGAGGATLPAGAGGTTGGAGGIAGGAGGAATTPGSGGAGPGSGGATMTGTGGHALDHCVYGYDPEASDATMKDGPAEYYPPGNMDPAIVDLTVQPEVLTWMQAHKWEGAHVEWHAIRTCNIPGGPIGSHINICQYTNLVPTDQNCQTGGDGYQFLLMHRHMLQALRQLWPNHTEQFTGFPHFPQTADDVPPQWRAAWQPFSATDMANGKIGDEIDKPENLAKFPDEGTLGFWLQCQVGTALKNRTDFALKSSGLHFALHAHWVRTGNTAHGVGNNDANVDNYMFWKLHGWIDNVWEKYRRAKGQLPTDQKYKDDLAKQCREMDTYSTILSQNLTPAQVPDPLPVESGFFHEQVRPIFENPNNKCSGCHSETGPEAGLSLGGNISSRKIVDAIVNKASIDGGQYKRIVPGQPSQSWLFLKVTNMAMSAGCVASSTAQCLTGVMPPDSSGHVTLSDADIATIKQWINDGAAGPP
jgi:hypothetical protein